MKQVININFQGRVVPIELTAYEILKDYIQSLNNYFAAEEGKEEIVNDIENRIGELFHQKIQAGNNCITEDDVTAVINSIGRTEDFDQEAGNEKQSAQNASAPQSESRPYRKLLRDENNKVLGGVCSGVAHYLGIDITVARVIFLILFFSFGIGFLAYIILWVVVPSSATLQMGSKRKRLFRDKEGGYIAGVCSGIAHYFRINVWIPRVIFLLPLIGFLTRSFRWENFDNWWHFNNFHISYSPGFLISYIIAWLVIPEAVTTSDKLEMKGEKVDMNSIKKSVMDEISGVQKRATKFANEASSFATATGSKLSNEIYTTAKSKNGFAEFFSLVAKVIAYFILGSILIAFLGALIALAIISIGIFPLKDFVITGTAQNLYAWGTLILFIAVPVIGIIVYVIRRITKVKTGTKYLAPSFSGLWILGWFCFIMLIVTVRKDFRKANLAQPQEVYLTNPGVERLEVTSFYDEGQLRLPETLNFTPFDWIDEDTAIAKNVTINIFRAATDSFRVVMYKSARGSTAELAAKNASMINFSIMQRDSQLVVGEGITINKIDKFRNQEVIVNIYVPVGKKIRINESSSNHRGVRIDLANNRNESRYYNTAFYGWDTNVDYLMKTEGMESPDGKLFREGEWGSSEDETVEVNENGVKIKDWDGKSVTVDEDGIRITDGKEKTNNSSDSTGNAIDKAKEEERKLKEEKRRIKDSLRNSIEETKRQLDQLKDEVVVNGTPQSFVLSSYNPGWMLSMGL